ncbi:hypothetical protein X751_10455 [Mesorhizobium sp. LNJC395A00]|nr:hypothetical protein X751_10455 [Mesorhizobium sp. LNJC395A00]
MEITLTLRVITPRTFDGQAFRNDFLKVFREFHDIRMNEIVYKVSLYELLKPTDIR